MRTKLLSSQHGRGRRLFTLCKATLSLSLLLLFAACSKDDADPGSGKTPLGLDEVSVVTTGSVTRATAAEFFAPGERVAVAATAAGRTSYNGTFVFAADGTWTAEGTPIYFEDVYVADPNPYAFAVKFGSQTLITDQRTAAEYHAAEYLTGPATLNTATRTLNAATLSRNHVQLVVTLTKGDYWPTADDFKTHIEGSTITHTTAGGTTVLPLTGEITDGYTFMAIIPLADMPSKKGDSVLELVTPAGSERALKLTQDVSGLADGSSLSVAATYDNLGMFYDITAEMVPWTEVDGGGLIGHTPESLAERERFLAWADECRAVASGNINIDFTLEYDIDLTGIDWEPIGDWSKRYVGTFDGNGQTIRGLKVDVAADFAGLFGVVDAGGVVKDLTLSGADVKTTGDYSGIITGHSKGSILGCVAVDSRVESSFNAGAMVGYQDGLVAGCMADNCSVTSGDAGGIAGLNAGNNGFSVIIGCRTRGGDMSGGYTGGIVGRSYKDIFSCYSTPSTLTGSLYAGVIVGHNSGNTCMLSDCRWKAVSGYTTAIGKDNNTVPQEGNCVEITGDNLKSIDVRLMNVAIGQYNSANPTNTCDYHWATTGNAVPGAPTVTQSDMELVRFLAWADECRAVTSGNIDIDFTLEHDIDITGIDWQSIGANTVRYTGTFDGNGKTISGLWMNNTATTYYSGLFGYLGTDGVVKNLTIRNADLKSPDNIAAVVGYNYGQVLGCNVIDCKVYGKQIVAGVVAKNDNLVAGCTATGCMVEATSSMGESGAVCASNNDAGVIIGCHADGGSVLCNNTAGIVGYNTGSVVASFGAPELLGTHYMGAVVGYNNGPGALTVCRWKAGNGYLAAIGQDDSGTDQQANCAKITGKKLSIADVTAMNEAIAKYNKVSTLTCDYHWADNGLVVAGSTSASELGRFIAWADKCRANTATHINEDFVLREDIDLGGVDWKPIGTETNSYIGTFDGNGKTIKGLKITTSDENAGLFGYIGVGGTVKDVTIKGAELKSENVNLAAVAGKNKGSVLGCTALNCSVTGVIDIAGVVAYNYGLMAGCSAIDCTIVSDMEAGGVCSTNWGGGTIVGCYTQGGSIAGNDIGTAAAYNAGAIISCYGAPASLAAGNEAGALVGLNMNTGTLITCYWTDGTGYTKAIATDYNPTQQAGNCVEIIALADTDVTNMNARILVHNFTSDPAKKCNYHWTTSGIEPGQPQ